jgi:hypothetical protein
VTPRERMHVLNAECRRRFGRPYVDDEVAEAMSDESLALACDQASAHIVRVLGLEAEKGDL